MAEKKEKSVITRSNYTLREKHKELSAGTIYQRDFMTITNGLGSVGNTIVPYNNSNFKFITKESSKGMKRHHFGKWLQPSNDKTYWSLTDLSDNTIVTSESKIIIKPDYKKITDFSYYGSAVELIEASVNEILEGFPAQLTITDIPADNYYRNDSDLFLETPVTDCCYVNNPFAINMSTDDTNNVNSYRIFIKNYDKYCLYNSEGNHYACVINYIVTPNNNILSKQKVICDDGVLYTIELTIALNEITENLEIVTKKIILYDTNYQGSRYLFIDNNKSNINLTDYSIRLANIYIEPFFDGLSEFSKLLMNRDSIPQYTAVLEKPYWTDYGPKFTYKKYTWPMNDIWNIANEDLQFNNYINELLEIAEYYDENRTNNLWGKIVHEAIKNMDRTHIDAYSNDISNDYELGTSRMESMFKSYGRLFDDIKLSIDNIKYVNNLTYDGANNIPDYFVSDSLDLMGWETTNITNGLDYNDSVKIKYPDRIVNYTTSDLNINFMRLLAMNSKEIFKHKGTRYGIEMLLSLFGYCSADYAKALSGKTEYDYEITEYSAIATPKGPIERTEEFNTYKNNYSEYNPDTLQGLPVRKVEIIDSTVGTESYLIPWFDKLQEIDGNPYFQMYGGWGKTYENINIPLQGDEDFQIYDETISYLGVVRNIADLQQISYDKINNGDIYYVTYIDDYDKYFTNSIPSGDSSNYFVIRNKDNITTYGEEGWNPIPNNDITNINGDGIKVVYLENIIEDIKGNNPHVGYGTYDSGEGYYKIFEQLFKNAIENNGFLEDVYDCDEQIKNEIKEIGFDIELQPDNMKCYYFIDNLENKINARGNISTLFENKTIFNTELKPYDFETTESGFTESSVNSIVNTKKVSINFKNNCDNKSFRTYLYKSVLPYLKQMMPATTIWNITIENEGVDFTQISAPEVVGMTEIN